MSAGPNASLDEARRAAGASASLNAARRGSELEAIQRLQRELDG